MSLLLLAGVGGLLWDTVPLCRAPEQLTATVEVHAEGRGQLRGGAGSSEVVLHFPVVVAGYGPPRSVANAAATPLKARAVVLEMGKVRLGIVSLDLVTMPEALAAEVRAETEGLGLTDLWCVATHAHSSVGGYDPHWLSEVAATGRYRVDVQASLVTSAKAALGQAVSGLQPASLWTSESHMPEWVASRNEVAEVDDRLTRVELRAMGGAPFAQLIVMAAHPTLAARHSEQLDPDYPGWLAGDLEAAGKGTVLVLQSAVGNAAVRHPPELSTPYAVARELARFFQTVTLQPSSPTSLRISRVSVELPAPDGSRLVPSGLRQAAANFLCANAPRRATLSLFSLGPLRWLSVPGEVTAEAARVIEQAAGHARVVGLVNGYLGYVEDRLRVERGEGEAKRQYFPAKLVQTLAHGAEDAERDQPLGAGG